MKKKLFTSLLMCCGMLVAFNVHAVEYINDTFSKWDDIGASETDWQGKDPNHIFKTITCIDGIDRIFELGGSKGITVQKSLKKGGCTDGALTLGNGGSNPGAGYIIFPKLPNINKVMIQRPGGGANVIGLEVRQPNGTWSLVERDGITDTNNSACFTWAYNFQSEDSVQIRLNVYDSGSRRNITWIYVEGCSPFIPGNEEEGTEDQPAEIFGEVNGSREPYIPPVLPPIPPNENLVRLFPNKADTIAFETLVGISSYGWDPSNKGILINWHREFPERVNNDSGGAYDNRNGNTRHDSQNDVRALQHYYWWKDLHKELYDDLPSGDERRNGLNYFDVAIARLLPTVKAKYAKTSSTKGWMYYVLLRIWETCPEEDKAFWEKSVRSWADNVMKEIDPSTGYYSDNNAGNCDCGSSTIYLDKSFRVDHQVQSGAALVHAGTLFNNPAWVTAGIRQFKATIDLGAFSETYDFFGRVFALGDQQWKLDAAGNRISQTTHSCKNKVWDPQVKIGEVSEEVDALLRAAETVKDPDVAALFYDYSAKMLNGLRKQIVHDDKRYLGSTGYGGFFQNMSMATACYGDVAGKLNGTKREMRQASLLGTYNIANRHLDRQWLDMEKEMYYIIVNRNDVPLKAMTTENVSTVRGMYLYNNEPEATKNELLNGYRKSRAGYTFELESNWVLRNPGNWVSNESNSLILLGIFEYLEAVKNGYDDSFINGAPNGLINTQINNGVKVWVDDNTLNISGASGNIRVFNIFGQSVALLPAANEKFDISNYSSGVYILQATTSSGKIVQTKFIKK
ncbi:MAG: T9SS type A sorting domain-containing protein [Candidatus Azobacteroides sp.]|nr:T9SS type A sorting domain-containing protein [Candidatus Azobacteroides sp.]